jgi:hypothetical protein
MKKKLTTFLHCMFRLHRYSTFGNGEPFCIDCHERHIEAIAKINAMATVGVNAVNKIIGKFPSLPHIKEKDNKE